MPNPILRLLNKILFFARREKFDNDLAEEMAYHRELKQRDLEASNPALTAKDARHAANREFGNDLYLRDQSRDVVGFWFETTLQDFRFSLRQLRKNLGFTVTAILMLALGMSASVAIFSFVDAALLKPLPYRDSNRLVGVFESIADVQGKQSLDPRLLRLEKTQRSLHCARGLRAQRRRRLSTNHGVEPVRIGRVSDGFFRVLGVAPILGRDFAPGEDLLSAPRTAILSYATWQKRYGGSPDVLGQSVVLDEKPTTIIGVLPRDFHFVPAEPAEFWTTLHPEGDATSAAAAMACTASRRLKDGVTLQQALANVTSIAQQLEHEYPDSNRDQGAFVTPLSEVHRRRPSPHALRSARRRRSSPRHRRRQHRQPAPRPRRKPPPRNRRPRRARRFPAAPDSSVRHRRSRRRYHRHRLRPCSSPTAECASSRALIPADFIARMPFWQDLGFSPRVLAFAAIIALLAAILFSLTPSLRVRVPDMRDDLAEGSRGSAGSAWRRLGSKLVVLELATAVVLLVIAGLLGKSLFRLLHVDIGMQPDHVATMMISAPAVHVRQRTSMDRAQSSCP